MKFVRFAGLVLKVILFILLLVLAINNMQTVEFNFFGYSLKLPLIVTLALFSFASLALGLAIGFFNSLRLKGQINKLNKELANQTAASNDNPTL